MSQHTMVLAVFMYFVFYQLNHSLRCTLFMEADTHLCEQGYGSSSEVRLDTGMGTDLSETQFLLLESKGRFFFLPLTIMWR